MKKSKKFPKITKHLKSFLTDESGKISKHNAMGVGAIGAIIGLIDGVDAHHCSVAFSAEYNKDEWSGGSAGTYYYVNQSGYPGRPSFANNTCGHASGIYNGSTGSPRKAFLNGGSSVTKGQNIGLTGIACNPGYANFISGHGNSGGDTTFFKDCGTYGSYDINGHFSYQGTTSASTASTTHTNSHRNY